MVVDLVDLSTPKRLHVVGVGGPGMSAIGIVLAEMGHSVSGSDVRDQPVLDRVRAAGVAVTIGHDPAVVHGVDATTASTAIPATNVEIVEARHLGVRVTTRAEMLASICAQASSIGVAGTHGKTTTTSMLMRILDRAGWQPSFVIGGDVAEIGIGARWTGRDWLVVEADESDGTHVQLPLQAAVVTNIDVDHLDHFGSFERIVESFHQLVAQTPGPTVVCADDEQCARLAALLGCTTYGTAAGADYLISNLQHVDGRQRFTIRHNDDDLVTISIALRGMFNVRNATAAAAMAHQLGVTTADIAAALETFAGVARRFDVRAVDEGATFVDDYAHIPAEIAAVLGAARHGADGWSRVIAVFQPNRFNRMAVLSPEYRDAFVDADVIAITEIYPSGTSPIAGVTGRLVVDAVAAAHPHARVLWIPHRDDLVDFAAAEARAGDVCISMGCGDIASFPDEVVARRRARREGSDAR